MFQQAIVVLTALANLSIGAVVIRKNGRSASHLLLAGLTLMIPLWTIGNYLALQPGAEEVRLFWVRAVMFVTTPFGGIIYLLAKTFPSHILGISKRRLFAICLFNIVTAALAMTPYMFSSLKNTEGGGFQLSPAPAIVLFGIAFMGFMFLGFYELRRKYIRSKGITRKQLQFLIIGLITSFSLLSITNFVAVVVFGSIELTSMGPPFTLILVLLTAYAIVKHRLFNISQLIARAISYTLLITIVSLVYSLAFFVPIFLLSPSITSNRWAMLTISITLSLVIALTLPRIKKITDKVTDKVFYKDHFDTQQLFDDLAEIITSTFETHKLAGKVARLLHTQIRSTFTSVVLVDGDKTETFSTSDTQTNIFSLDDLSGFTKSITVFDDLEESSKKELMAKNNISLIAKMDLKGETVGYLLFGEKASGEIYYEDDLNVIPTVADQLAVAFENALSIQQIRRFNITLREEVRKATHELKEANDQLKQLDKLKDEFVSLASHELRTPMTSIKGSIAMILEGYAGKVSLKTRKLLTAAFNENDRLIRLVNNLLNSSRIEAGRFTFKVSDVDLHQIIKEVVSNLQMAALEKKIFLKFSGKDAPLMVKADSDKIREVIINFIGNALKFTVKGGVTLTAEQADGMVTIHVSDTGPGISQSGLKMLFKKFSQVHDKTVVHPGGTGLGLYISKQIVEGLGGKIWVESKLGEGSTFSFSLPAINLPSSTTQSAEIKTTPNKSQDK